MPVPNNFGSNEPTLQRRVFGMPMWAIISGGAVLFGLAYHFYRKNKAAQAQNPQQITANAPVTLDQNGQIPWQYQWPYNQLALPYGISTITNPASGTNPGSSSFPGYSYTSSGTPPVPLTNPVGATLAPQPTGPDFVGGTGITLK